MGSLQLVGGERIGFAFTFATEVVIVGAVGGFVAFGVQNEEPAYAVAKVVVRGAQIGLDCGSAGSK